MWFQDDEVACTVLFDAQRVACSDSRHACAKYEDIGIVANFPATFLSLFRDQKRGRNRAEKNRQDHQYIHAWGLSFAHAHLCRPSTADMCARKGTAAELEGKILWRLRASLYPLCLLSRKGVGIFDAEKAEHDRSIWRKTQEVIVKYMSDGFCGVLSAIEEALWGWHQWNVGG